MIQSGNWSENSIPFNEGDGVVVGHVRDRQSRHGPGGAFAGACRLLRRAGRARHAAGAGTAAGRAAAGRCAVASRFTGQRDLLRSRAAGDSRDAVHEPDRDAVGAGAHHAGRSRRRISTTTLKAFLRSATRSIRIEQQYIRGGQPAVEALLAGDRRRARRTIPDLDVRIIVSPKFLDGDKQDEVPQGDGRLRLRVRRQLSLPVRDALRALPQQADRRRRREGAARLAELVDDRA